ncbi:MAG: arylsulfatase [Planctomycetes bacterium]|nr:arylsulfatase [Planctomycetota bacterium]
MHDRKATLTRRTFLRTVTAAAAAAPLVGCAGAGRAAEGAKRLNVLLIMTDDQGWGDLGCHGNEKIRTPQLDRLASQSVEMTQFYVQPVCAPTRACLMTGRYNYRTGVTDTYLGRAMMHADEVTLAEMLGRAGYATGIFGKWHLGDTYPLRPIDQGFQTGVWHLGGGMSQPADPPESTGYVDAIYQVDGAEKRLDGYCTDVFADACIRFIEANRDRPFFAYLPTNAPHTPLLVPDKYWQPYAKMGLDETTAKVYGMIENVDENVGKILARLDALGLAENTLVIFLTDNGPQQRNRYNGVLRATKGTVYEGGIRVPFFARWPGRIEAGRKVEAIAAHIDVVPTVLEACGAAAPEGVRLDGTSLLPLWTGRAGDWPARTLFFQWHRGDEPELYRSAAAREPRWKLVMPGSAKKPVFELYDIPADPGEKQDVAAGHPEIVQRLRAAYEAWLKDVSATRGYDPPRIYLGSTHENPVRLSRQDWRGPDAGWTPTSLGYWEVHVAQAGAYEVAFLFQPAKKERTAVFELGDVRSSAKVPAGDGRCTFENVTLKAGDGRLHARLEGDGPPVGVNYVIVKRV